MHIRSLVSVATLSLASLSAFAAGGDFDRTLQISGNPAVMVSTNSGSIRLRAGSDSQIHIAAHLYSSNNVTKWFGGGSGNLQGRIDSITANPPIQQNGNQVVIGERNGGDKYRDINIDYEITLPRGSEIDASSGSGDIESQDVGGNVKAGSGSGSVRVRGNHGPATLHTGSGDIELDEAGDGAISARTGSGSIRLRSINGPVEAHTGSGDIELNGHLSGDSRLETGSGSVRLSIGNQGYNLDAHTGSGSIHTAGSMNVSSDEDHHSVSGPINGGGPAIHIRTGSGDVEIR